MNLAMKNLGKTLETMQVNVSQPAVHRTWCANEICHMELQGLISNFSNPKIVQMFAWNDTVYCYSIKSVQESGYIALYITDKVLRHSPGWPLNQRSSSFCLSSAEIIGLCQHTQVFTVLTDKYLCALGYKTGKEMHIYLTYPVWLQKLQHKVSKFQK